MKPEKKYYLKWDVDNKSFLLDTSYRVSDFTYGIRQVLVTPEQAEQFSELISRKYLDRNKYIDMNVLEFEFDQFFLRCKDCGVATTKVDHVKRQGKLCYDCYQLAIRDNWKMARRETIERERVARMAEYIKTPQGRADILGAKAIKANIMIQLKLAGKSRGELAARLGRSDSSLSTMLNHGKSIRISDLFDICEWLFVPIDLLLKPPRGAAPLKKKNNIPVVIYKKPMKTVK